MRATMYTGLILGVAIAATGGSTAFARERAPAANQAIDPEAVQALEKTGAYLRTLQAFQVNAVTSREYVLDDGQKVEFAATAELVAKRPDRLRMEVKSDRSDRIFLFDGKTFTLVAPRMKYYASVAAPPTIGQLADSLEAKYDIELPLVDLFRWGTPQMSTSDITAARDIGPSEVDGVTCEQYAYRQDGMDWQLWVQRGDYPLPRKVVLTTTTDDARPEYTATYTWNLAPSFNDQAFVYTPPKDAYKIVLTESSPVKVAERP